MSLAFQTWPASSMPRVLRPYRIYHRNEHIVYETNSLQNEYCLVDPRVIFIYTPFQKFRAAMWKLQISTNKEAKHLLKGVPPRSLSLSLSRRLLLAVFLTAQKVAYLHPLASALLNGTSETEYRILFFMCQRDGELFFYFR